MQYDFSERNKNILKTRNQRIRSKQIANSSRIIKASNSTVFFTGGIGDVLALESYFTQRERDNLETIYYATRKSDPIIEIFQNLNNYPRLRNHVVVYDDFSKFWCFYSKEECLVHLKSNGLPVPDGLLHAEDWSIANKFTKINSNYITYNSSSPVNLKLCGVSEFDLPKNYISICPYSSDKRVSTRDFSKDDWKNTSVLLDRLEMTGVLLNSGIDICPVYDNIIDLSNQTSIIEAIEILKNGCGYIGVNSVLSVLAAKLFHNNLFIKSSDEHCHRNRHIYYAPKKTFEFLKGGIYAD